MVAIFMFKLDESLGIKRIFIAEMKEFKTLCDKIIFRRNFFQPAYCPVLIFLLIMKQSVSEYNGNNRVDNDGRNHLRSDLFFVECTFIIKPEMIIPISGK